jgi:hypothetical protein
MLNRLRDVFKSFQRHDVKYVVIGGIASVLSFQGDRFFVLSKEDLIRSKRAAGRDIDLEDVRLLESGGQRMHNHRVRRTT